MTGCERPPKRASRSSINFRWAALRETAASKMWKLPTFFTRRTAFLASRR